MVDFRHADNPAPFSKMMKERMENYLIDREAELRMSGLTEKEAKEKAMEDWHTYYAPK